jgi:hypothetical protein
MTIDELIEMAEDARVELGGDAEVRVAYQRNYPIRGTVEKITIPQSEEPYATNEQAAGQENDGRMLWIAVGAVSDGENSYGPSWAWA